MRPFSWRSCLSAGSSYIEPDLLKDIQEVYFLSNVYEAQ